MILVFAGDIQGPGHFVRCPLLEDVLKGESNFLPRFMPKGHHVESFSEVLTIRSSPRSEIQFLSLSDVFHPFCVEYGRDYSKIFVDDRSYHE